MQIVVTRHTRIVGIAGVAVAVALLPCSVAVSEQLGPSQSREPDIRFAPIQVHRNPDGTLAEGSPFRLLSGNWSGYILRSRRTGERYTSAAASWTIPSVTYRPGFSLEASAIWVGIGGMCASQQCDQKDSTLIQLVTVHKATAAGVTYAAKYQMIPNPPVAVPIPIKPGDRITATVECVARCASDEQSWALSMTDDTTGVAWGPYTFDYRSSELSAEWIVEAPSSSGGVLPLADFDMATLGPQFGANGHIPSLTPAANGIAMRGPYGQWAIPSVPNNRGFNVCWYGADPGAAACPDP
jgi:hypothetical protein